MKLSFRWYGQDDPVALRKIRQIPMISNVVSAVYGVPPGQVWPEERIAGLKDSIEQEKLAFEVVESVAVHEDIKLGRKTRDGYIDNYCETIRRLGKAGVKVICYNFMPVFDWLRSDLQRIHEDGSSSLAYSREDIMGMDPARGGLSLPGWDESFQQEELKELLIAYEPIGKEELWENLAYFLHSIIPVCQESGVKMAIHPDDPPWDIFGLPRIITGEESYRRLRELNSSELNGITLCTGSLGALRENQIESIASAYCERIHFVHARNVKRLGKQSFEESAHPSALGDLDIFSILKSLHNSGFDGYIRPDHGRMIWGESGRPGYGLYDRALGAAYIWGLWEALEKS